MKSIGAMLAVFGLDYFTKKWANKKLAVGKKQAIVKDRLYFWHIKNYGLAYHKFTGKQKEILLFTGGIITVYATMLLQTFRNPKDKIYRLPLALVLGGGIGNFWERLKKGSVTDFLFIKKGSNAPIFNVADIAVFLGAIWLVVSNLTLILEEKRKK